MGNRKSIASVLLFAGSVLCFFFPFVTVSCGGQKIFTLSGQQLATGTEIAEPQVFGPAKTQKTDANPFAAVAGLCALAGVALSLVGTKLAAAGVVSGAAGAVSLGIMASRMDGQIQRATEGMGKANVEVGFVLTLSLLVAAAAWNIYLLTQGKKAAISSSISAEDSHAPTGAGAMSPAERQTGNDGYSSVRPVSGAEENFGFCGECGAKLKDASRFCSSCGAQV